MNALLCLAQITFMKVAAQRQNKLWLLLLFLVACIPAQADRDIPAELNCQSVQMRQPQTTSSGVIEITVAANAYRDFCWKLYGIVLAADQVQEYPIRVVPTLHNMVGPAFQALLAKAFTAGNAPDIISSTDVLVQTFAQAGHLAPLNDCVARYPEFAKIHPPAWSKVTEKGQIWGIPFEIGTFLFYFNKQKLAALGWSPDEIAALPRNIAAGQFTLHDLLTVAQQAIQLGVVEPGFAFWPHLDDPWTLQLTYVAHGGRLFDEQANKLVITQTALTAAYAFHQMLFQRGLTYPNLADPNHTFNDLVMWEDAVVHDRVLFWVGGNDNWPMLAFEYQDDLGAKIEPSELVGYALFPTAHRGGRGQALWVQTGFYALTASSASKYPLRQAAACALLAQTMTPAIAVRHSARSGLMSTLSTEAMAPYWQNYPFLKAQAQMWPHLVALPHHLPAYSEQYVPILNQRLAQVQAGTLSAAAASELAILELHRQLRDGLIVE
jgi:inositol-phosphate transport system substrate-binding protein